ncbi:MAG: hypothetical protein HYU28_06040 [Actinobacteria bacterium]|nr:hypothetical protein [Actinomycetota bacterium]
MNYFRERVLEPILIPLVAVAFIGFGVLNMSRLFLASGHANRSVIVATAISTAILVGATWATSRDHIDRGVLLAGGAMLGIVLAGAGLLAQQVDLDREAEAHGGEGGEAVAAGSEVTVPTEGINFPTKEFSASPGAIKFNYAVADGTHTLVVEGFEDAFKLEASGPKTVSGVFELEAGDYVLYCDVPGHRGAGMEGALTVAEGAGTAPAGGGEAAEGEAAEGEAAEGEAAGGGAPVKVTAVDINFPEKEFTAPAGTVSFEYVNDGAAPHTLVVEGFESDMKIDLAGGESGTGSLELEAGAYVIYCDVPGHRGAGMEAKLAVT